jgi:hypothetical protein
MKTRFQTFAFQIHDLCRCTVEEMDLSYNNIDDAGVATIARLLKVNRSLKSVNLSGNNIGAEVGRSPGGGVSGGCCFLFLLALVFIEKGKRRRRRRRRRRPVSLRH